MIAEVADVDLLFVQVKGNFLLFPQEKARKTGPVRCRERLGGLLKFYHRVAA